MTWERVNRNSDAQFMRSRVQMVHVSKTFAQEGNFGLLWSPGQTYRAPRRVKWGKRGRRLLKAARRAEREANRV